MKFDSKEHKHNAVLLYSQRIIGAVEAFERAWKSLGKTEKIDYGGYLRDIKWNREKLEEALGGEVKKNG